MDVCSGQVIQFEAKVDKQAMQRPFATLWTYQRSFITIH
jgi:hypothetical protein